MDNNQMQKRYGLFTAICMVVGIVIGSGVFLKAGGVLSLSGGDLKISLLAWLIGGLIMVSLGIIGHYLARIYDEVKGRPRYIIARETGKEEEKHE